MFDWYIIIIIFFGVIYVISASCFLYYLIYIKLDFLQKEEGVEIPEKYKPFVRHDRKTMNIAAMFFGCIFLLPIRVILIIISLLFNYIIAKILVRGNQDNTEIEYNPLKRKIEKFTLKWSQRLILFASGIIWIKKKYQKISFYDPTYPEKNYKDRQELKNPPIIISNHQSFFDISFIATIPYGSSVVSKAQIGQIPILGIQAKARQCLFVKRESEEDRNSSIQAINRRAINVQKGLRYPPIGLFVEGTVSNGRYLLSFKKGAFQKFIPIKMFIIKYGTKGFSPYLDVINPIYVSFLFLCQIYTSMTVIELDTYFPDHLNCTKEDDWVIYSNTCRQIMLKAGNFKDSQSGYREEQEYENYLKDKYNLGSKKKR